MMQTDHELMGRALELARRAWGKTHPNPMVGALVVEDGEIVAEGWHAKDGGPHAERVALANLGRKPRPGATMVVTLEPCSTAGRRCVSMSDWVRSLRRSKASSIRDSMLCMACGRALGKTRPC